MRIAGNGRELISTARELPGNENDQAGNGRDPAASSGQDAAGYGPESVGNDYEPGGNGREPASAGAHARRSDSSPQPIDVVRTEMPPADPADGASDPALAAGNGGRTPDGTPDDGRSWPDSLVWRTGAATDANKPWLPRRVRQASLAPQLKTEVPAVPEDARVTAGGADDANGLAPEGPDPADTRALVQSLQFGLELARTTDAPADESWPPPAGESWPPQASEPWQSPTGNLDLAARPEDDGGP